MTITNNTIRHRTSGEVRGSTDGIGFKGNDNHQSGGGHYIAGNTIIGGWDGIGGEEEGSHHGTFDRDTIVENNTIQNTWDDCIQSEGGDQDVIIRGNDLSGCGTGIAFAAPVTGPLYLENNYIHDLVTGLYDNHFCYKVGQGGGGTTYMTGNTCEVTAAPGQEADGIHQTSENLSPIVSKRNIYRVSRYIFTMGYPSIPSGTDFDEDCMWTTNENLFKWNNVYYTNLARFQQATGQERNGRLAQDCSFLGTPTPPAASSPAAPTTPGAPQSTPTAAGQTPSAQPTPAPAGQTPSVRPTSTPEETAGSDDDVLTSPVALGLEALAGLTLLGLGFIVGVRWSRRHRPAP